MTLGQTNGRKCVPQPREPIEIEMLDPASFGQWVDKFVEGTRSSAVGSECYVVQDVEGVFW